MAETLLTILVPSNNRRSLLESQVVRAIQVLQHFQLGEARLLVSETSSIHETSSCVIELQAQALENFEYIFTPKPFYTAEEHVLARLSIVDSLYVWVLSDDDEPCLDAIDTLRSVLITKHYSYVVFDSHTIGAEGRDCSLRYGFGPGIHPMPMSQFLASYGFWHVMAALSCAVFRAAPDIVKILQSHLSISPIYAHVTAFVELYASEPVCAVGSALVWYNKNPYDESPSDQQEDAMDNWSKFAVRHRCCMRYPWTLGFTSLLSRLIALEKISVHDVRTTIDRNWDQRFVWNVQFVWQTLEQCLSDIHAMRDSVTQSISSTLLGDSISHTEALDWNSFSEILLSFIPSDHTVDAVGIALDSYRDILACSSLLRSDSISPDVANLITARMAKKQLAFEVARATFLDGYFSTYHWDVELYLNSFFGHQA